MESHKIHCFNSTHQAHTEQQYILFVDPVNRADAGRPSAMAPNKAGGHGHAKHPAKHDEPEQHGVKGAKAHDEKLHADKAEEVHPAKHAAKEDKAHHEGKHGGKAEEAHDAKHHGGHKGDKAHDAKQHGGKAGKSKAK